MARKKERRWNGKRQARKRKPKQITGRLRQILKTMIGLNLILLWVRKNPNIVIIGHMIISH